MIITKDQFDKYEACRASGVTNMYDTTTIEQITKLKRDQIFYIRNNYTALNNQYGTRKKGGI